MVCKRDGGEEMGGRGSLWKDDYFFRGIRKMVFFEKVREYKIRNVIM